MVHGTLINKIVDLIKCRITSSSDAISLLKKTAPTMNNLIRSVRKETIKMTSVGFDMKNSTTISRSSQQLILLFLEDKHTGTTLLRGLNKNGLYIFEVDSTTSVISSVVQHDLSFAQPSQSELISHPMVTRFKSRIRKPIQKLCLTARKHPLPESNFMEPTCYSEACKNPKWRKEMDVQINALIRNVSYSLVKYEEGMNFVGSKWVFRGKKNPYGSIERYKARLVAKGFN
ncbi:uncharacterized protein LOC113291055 [Papaver somniferum]|uniref:uncharacterized protein LOC113291055 n=1 Tax=Papaver somniferum TaxID=3469 RepID=UPI000E700C12|nr:uncharacterized protein LOC113291055 [Papaver somniferum]